MTLQLIDRLKQFQEHLLEVGLARAVLALPAPRMALAAPTTDSSGPDSVFSRMVIEPEIQDVSRDLFVSGHYSLSVQEAYKAVEKYIKEKGGSQNLSGTTLMDVVFSPKDPRLFWSKRNTQSEIDEQMGYHRLYAGAMLGIRNPVIHEFNWIEDGEIALELILFAQHLLRKGKAADVTNT